MKLILSLLFTMITVFSTFSADEDTCLGEDMNTVFNSHVDDGQLSSSADHATSLNKKSTVFSCDDQNDTDNHTEHTCHSCHLGHCAALITKINLNLKALEEIQIFSEVSCFISHTHTRLFRPPIV